MCNECLLGTLLSDRVSFGMPLNGGSVWGVAGNADFFEAGFQSWSLALIRGDLLRRLANTVAFG